MRFLRPRGYLSRVKNICITGLVFLLIYYYSSSNSVTQFPKFEFEPSWMQSRQFWDDKFEKRYVERRNNWKELPLKVFLMPHSHNDPGWKLTFDQYYNHPTSHILNHMIEKLTLYKDMTFIWSEVCFLDKWYEKADPSQRQRLRELVTEGRLEVMAGGWVMPDEASTHIYALVDQMVIGHQWLNRTLGVKPTHGWSVDPFGHGAAVPYVLQKSSITGTVIQRIHYAWKQWLAEQQLGDFSWRQTWDEEGDADIQVHNRPFDLYAIHHSCGPHIKICHEYDFMKVKGEDNGRTAKSVPVDASNVEQKAEQLLGQYGRQGSLAPHNVVLVPIGDDFRYKHAVEWEQQYTNYQKLVEHINSNPSKYHATIQWGTVKDYFKEVRARVKELPTLQGDFFVYSDIYSEGKPAYWSGYYTTRPYWKVLVRQLQSVLRSAEILYTWAWAKASQQSNVRVTQYLEMDYDKLVKARENLGLFQHHDGITGTSISDVMKDYAKRMFQSYLDSISVSAHCSTYLMMAKGTVEYNYLKYLKSDIERPTYEKLPNKIPIVTDSRVRMIVLFNSLGQQRLELVKILVTSPNFRLSDEKGNNVPIQINPVWNGTNNGLLIAQNQFEIIFFADIPALSLVTYSLHPNPKTSNSDRKAVIYSNLYAPSPGSDGKPLFEMRNILPGDIQIDSNSLKLLFDKSTGMLQSVTNKKTGKVTQTSIKFASYPSARGKSGAYLFKPDSKAKDPEKDVLAGAKPRIFILSGPVASELIVMFGFVLMHTIRIFHVAQEPLETAICVENTFDFGGHYNSTETPGFRSNYMETELFMRIISDIDNGINPVFYSDQSGLHMQKRVKVEHIGIQGNYFFITTAAYIEDSLSTENPRRLTLLTDHGQGAASWQKGWLEVMLERKSAYDDARGMQQGVTDQKITTGRHWLQIESLAPERKPNSIARLSVGAHHLSNTLLYPLDLFVAEGLEPDSLEASAHLITHPLPCNLHLLGMKVLPVPQYPGRVPSSHALMHVHNQSPECSIHATIPSCTGLGEAPTDNTALTIKVNKIEKTDLTGSGTNEGELKSLSELSVPQHQIRTVLVTLDGSALPV